MSYSPSTVFGLVGLGVLVVFGAFGVGITVGRRYQFTLTRYHLPAIVLVVLALTVGITAVVGAESMQRDLSRIDYSVEPCNETAHGPPGDDQKVSEFQELSLGGQDVFISALRADGEYSSAERPSEFDYSSDTTELNYVEYGSTCYVLQAWGPGPLAGIGIYLLLVGGGLLAVLLLGVGLGSLVWPSFKLPLAALVGLTGTAALVNAVSLSGRQFLAVLVGLPLLVWVVLRVLESRLGWRFRDRMAS